MNGEAWGKFGRPCRGLKRFVENIMWQDTLGDTGVLVCGMIILKWILYFTIVYMCHYFVSAFNNLILYANMTLMFIRT
jgi:hypothetical protein